jgi:hypothetical protein
MVLAAYQFLLARMVTLFCLADVATAGFIPQSKIIFFSKSQALMDYPVR